jgi:hypothetical protein
MGWQQKTGTMRRIRQRGREKKRRELWVQHG